MPLSGVLAANPHLTDYYHRLSFSPSGSVEMSDGAGHLVISIVQGKFSQRPIDQHSFQVNFYDLVEVNPYKRDEQVRALEPESVKVTREEGLFAFKNVSAPGGTESSKWPCFLYWARYFFEVDPLARLSVNRQGSAYHRVMVEPDTRYYYSRDDLDLDTLTVSELADLEVSPQPFAHAREEWNGKIVFGYR